MKTGLFGGTFNPLHNGHVKVVFTVLEELNLDRVLIIPAAIPPHKSDSSMIPFDVRCKLISESFRGISKVFLSDLDHNPNRKSYTKILIDKLRKIYPEDEFYFVIGKDNIPDLKNWYEFEWLIQNIKFIAVNRIINTETIMTGIDYLDKIHLLDNIPVDISSSDIRSRIKQHQSYDNLVPKPVFEYLSKNSIFLS